MKTTRRMILAATVAAVASFPLFSFAQDAYPSKPIQLVVPYPPGGGADGLARLVGQKMSEELGQPIVIINKPGANTILASGEVARASHDGYTLLYVASAFAINPSLYKLPYDTIKAFAPVGMVAEVPLIIIRNDTVQYNTVSDLIAAAKAKPGDIFFASYGQGSPAHLGGELLQSMAGISMTHVPYKGSAPALQDLIGGQVPVDFSSIEPALQLIRAKRVHPIAVTTKERISALPNVPTVAETVPGYEAIGWNGVVAPAGTPDEVVDKLNKALNSALKSPEVVKQYTERGVEAVPMSPGEFGKMVSDEVVKWGNTIKEARIKVN